MKNPILSTKLELLQEKKNLLLKKRKRKENNEYFKNLNGISNDVDINLKISKKKRRFI
jgi:hypothetical protein